MTEETLAVGTRNARKLYRAEVIALATGDSAAARGHFEASLRQNPRSEVAGDAKRALQES